MKIMKIALTNLGQYNEGRLNYTWLELPYTDDDLQAALDAIDIDGVNYEEYFISDYETDIPDYTIDEYENLSKLNELADRIDELDDYDRDKLYAIMEADGGTLDDALGRIDELDDYAGVTLEDLISQMIDEEMFSIETLLNYIDLEALARDLSYDGYTETSNGVIYTGYKEATL